MLPISFFSPMFLKYIEDPCRSCRNSVRLFPSFMFFSGVIFLFSQDVNKDQSNDNKKFTPKPPDFFSNGLPSTYLEEPKTSLDTTAKTTENDLIHVSVLNLHLAEMKKILQKERE